MQDPSLDIMLNSNSSNNTSDNNEFHKAKGWLSDGDAKTFSIPVKTP